MTLFSFWARLEPEPVSSQFWGIVEENHIELDKCNKHLMRVSVCT